MRLANPGYLTERTAMARAPAKRSNRRSSPKALSTDAIEMLKADHKAVNGLFKEFEKLHEDGDDTSKVIQFVREALVIHSALEKEIFYPAVRERAGEEEEENEMFPKVRRLKRLDLSAVGAQMEKRKATLLRKAMR